MLTQRFVRTRIYWRLELIVLGFVYRSNMLESAMHLSHSYLEKQVKDPILRAKLTPQYTIGCKRVLLSDDFYPALTQLNVEVITDRIREVKANSIVTEDGLEHEIDAIWHATLQRGLDEGEFRADVDVALAYRFIRDILFTAARWWISVGNQPSDDAITRANAYQSFILHGLLG